MNLEHPQQQPHTGDMAQIRLMGEQIADAAIVRFNAQNPPVVKAEVPAPLKWAGAIIAALFTAGTATLAFWLVSSVSDMQVTLARMDERLANQADGQGARNADIERRVARLEAYHTERSGR